MLHPAHLLCHDVLLLLVVVGLLRAGQATELVLLLEKNTLAVHVGLTACQVIQTRINTCFTHAQAKLSA